MAQPLASFADTPEMAARLAFIETADQLKSVLRMSSVTDGSRRENSAEHSWHLALMAITFADFAPTGTDLSRVVKMLLLHDLVEIDAGDTYVYDEVGLVGKAEREARAADRIFGLLPAAQAVAFREIWDEFEARETAESAFANALDRLQPILLNTANSGELWQTHGIRRSQVVARNRHVGNGSPALWDLAQRIIDHACAMGWIIDDTAVDPQP